MEYKIAVTDPIDRPHNPIVEHLSFSKIRPSLIAISIPISISEVFHHSTYIKSFPRSQTHISMVYQYLQ